LKSLSTNFPITLYAALKPFFTDTNGTYFTPATARDWTKFGYTYPETAANDPTVVRRAVNSLYSNQSTPSNRSMRKRASTLHHYESTENPRDYIVNVRADKTGAEMSYSVRIFIGNFTSDPLGWENDNNLVGTHSVFAKSMGTVPPGTLLTSGVVLLKKRLMQDFRNRKLGGLTEEYVVPYLTKNMHWRIQKVSCATTVQLAASFGIKN
jgi:tyrosinase